MLVFLAGVVAGSIGTTLALLFFMGANSRNDPRITD